MLLFLDGFFWVFHTVLIFFNLFGWIPARLRIWNLATLGLTLVSWLLMGLWNGIGYCVCTDYHFQIRRQLGLHDDADTYLQLLIFKLTSWNPPIDLVNTAAGICITVAVASSLALNIRDWRRRRLAAT